jgi:predicted XRE-type DNA-binding protein
MKKAKQRDFPWITESSGNVFRDIGLRNPDQHLAKAELVYRLHSIMRERKLTQRKTASILGLEPSKLGAIFQGHFTAYSTVRLLRFLVALRDDVEIVVRPRSKNARTFSIHLTAA